MVQEYLNRLGWTATVLAKHLGVHRSTITRWKQGEVPVPHAVQKWLIAEVNAIENQTPAAKPLPKDWRQQERLLRDQRLRQRPFSNHALPRTRNGVSKYFIDSDFS